MKRFSERMGFKPTKNILQIDSIDEHLMTKLWNNLYTSFWHTVKYKPMYGWFLEYEENEEIVYLIKDIYEELLNKTHDEIPNNWKKVFKEIKSYFFTCSWDEVYDLIEFVINNPNTKPMKNIFSNRCNKILEQELAGYRVVSGTIAPVTSKEEIAGVEEAIQHPLQPVSDHLKDALRLLSDRKNPNYRNSIKESISAVEALCNLIAKKKKATLGQALDVIERQRSLDLHPALKEAYKNLYGYTSDADGIRHAMMDKPHLSIEDAKYMLVSCSAFVNYLIEKANKAGISLK